MSRAASGPLLICYDGSDGARAALEQSARLFSDRAAVVACYWQPFAQSRKQPLAHEILELVQDPSLVNEREEQLAKTVADEGAGLAQAGGLAADGRAVEVDVPIDEAILAHADELEAEAIVLGARARPGFRSLILGNVANDVVQNAARPVFVVPSPQMARRRRDQLTSVPPSL